MEKRPKKLLDQVREAIRFKYHSIRTGNTYVAWNIRTAMRCLCRNSGARTAITERVRFHVKDVDFTQRQIVVQDFY